MNKLYKIEDTVKNVLIEIPSTRDDDFKLIAEVYYELGFDINTTSFGLMMLGHKEFGLPPFESITRARRKLQATYEELRSSKEVAEARLNKTSDYIDYAIDGYSSNFMKFVDSCE